MAAATENRRNRRAELPVLERLPHRFGYCFGFVLVGLSGGEHDDKEGKQQGNEVGIGYQPALMIFVGFGPFFPHQASPTFRTRRPRRMSRPQLWMRSRWVSPGRF